MGRMHALAALLALLALAGACARRPPESLPAPTAPPEPAAPPVPVPEAIPPVPQGPAFVEVPWEEAGGLPLDDLAFGELEPALRQSLAWLERLPEGRRLALGTGSVGAGVVARGIRELLAILAEAPAGGEARAAAIRSRLRLVAAPGPLLLTGYYEPVLEGRLQPDARFRFPLYRRPPDLVSAEGTPASGAGAAGRVYGRLEEGRLVPYYTREEIDGGGVLKNRGLEIAWLEDPVDVFFLQVQGSGRLRLEDGRVVRVQFDGKNGHPYTSLGAHLAAEGLLPQEKASMQEIRRLLSTLPEAERQRHLSVNPAYTFFRLEEGEAPLGSLGVPLTPGRSLAVDGSVYPQGAVGLLISSLPVVTPEGLLAGWVPFRRFVAFQDAGGAILGAGRADLFCGAGEGAEAVAGRLKAPGRLLVLLPKDADWEAGGAGQRPEGEAALK
ncbi:MAG: murein transglycosylase A [Acidobacteriota bacterium]